VSHFAPNKAKVYRQSRELGRPSASSQVPTERRASDGEWGRRRLTKHTKNGLHIPKGAQAVFPRETNRYDDLLVALFFLLFLLLLAFVALVAFGSNRL
jgi:hypothetical protein